MLWMLIGLTGFIASHLVRVVAEHWRTKMVQLLGAKNYKRIYSLITLVSLVLIIWGYGTARHESPLLWTMPLHVYPLTAVLMLLSMICLAGFHIAQSHLSVKLRHPMLWSVVLLCSAHLIVNGRLIDALLFGSLLVWSVVDLISCYKRDRQKLMQYPQAQTLATVWNLLMGFVFYGVFAFFLHRPLIGVSPILG